MAVGLLPLEWVEDGHMTTQQISSAIFNPHLSLLVTSASLLVTGALLVVTRS